MKILVIVLLILSLTALLFGCAINSEVEVPRSQEEAVEVSSNLTDDVGSLTEDLEDIDSLLS